MKIDFLNGPSITISAGPDDWQLYSAEDLESDQERDFAAEDLNRGIEKIIAQSPTRSDIPWQEIGKILSRYSRWGAADSEGYHMVNRIINKVYGE
jgi:hypothetical protein